MEATETEIKRNIKDYILREFLAGESPDALDDSTPLITTGVLDSIATVKLISYIEEEYGVEFEAHEMNADNLNTLPDIVRIVQSKRAAK